MQHRRSEQRQRKKERGRWYGNDRDSDSYNSVTTIGEGRDEDGDVAQNHY
mgnify:CR=1 FL=1